MAKNESYIVTDKKRFLCCGDIPYPTARKCSVLMKCGKAGIGLVKVNRECLEWGVEVDENLFSLLFMKGATTNKYFLLQ